MKKKLLTVLMSVLTLAAVGMTAACDGGSGGEDTNRTEIVVGGSSSISPLLEVLGGVFEVLNPEYKVSIVTNDSGTGISNAKNGTYEIGMASKTVADPELDSHVICKDGLALIVKSTVSDVTSVTPEQLRALYVEGVKLSDTVTKAISREEGSGTRDAFDKEVKIGVEDDLDGSVQILNGTGAVIQGVENDGNTIGYVSLGSADKYIREGKGIKKLQYKGAEATAENIVSGAYTFARDFTLVTKKGATLSAGAKKLLDFINGSIGRAVMAEEGYVLLS